MTLKSDKKIHQVLLKLDKDIPRELALRQFLDKQVDNGIDRKETILRLFEAFNDIDPLIKLEKPNEKKYTNEEKIYENINRLEIIETKKSGINASDFEE